MRCVYVAENAIDAHLVRDQLVDGGIPAEIHGADLTGGFGLLPGYVSVWVPEAQASDADSALEQLRPSGASAADDPDLLLPDGALPI